MDLAQLAIRADSSDLVRAKRDLDALPQSSKRAESATSSLTKSYSSMGVVVTRLIGVLGAAGLGRAFLVAVDANTKFTAQLKLATQTQTQFNTALADVQRIAKTAQSDIGSVATLYARLNSSLREFGVTQAEVARITENVGLALKVSGATAAEASSAIMQLSQAFASGVLRGEEFNAVSESAPALMRALADSIGVPIGQLRAMAAEGQITGDVLNKAFGDERLLDKFRQQAQEVKTIAGAFTQLKNSLVILSGQVSTTSGVGASFADILSTIARNIESVANVIKGDLKGAFDSILPAYREFKRLQDKEASRALPAATTAAGGILPQGSRIDEPLRRDLGLISDVTETTAAFNGLKKQLDELRTNNPLKDLTTANQEYAQGLAIIRANVLAMNMTQAEGQRYEAQLKSDWEKATKGSKSYAVAENTRRDEALKDLQSEIDFEMEIRETIDKAELKAIEDIKEAKLKADKEVADAREKYLSIEQKRANDNFKEAQEAYRNQVSNYEKIFDRANENLSRSLTDSIVRGFENGEKFITNFKNAITNAFKGYFVNIGVNFVQEQLSDLFGGIGKSIFGAFAGGQASFVDGIMQDKKTGFGGVLSDLGSIFTKSNQSIIGGIESVGASIANGMGGIRDTIGGFLGSNASLVANVASYGGAVLQLAQGNWAGAAGTAIGTALGGPVGGAIGSFLGGAVGSLFGGKKYKRYGTTVSGFQGAGGEYSKTGQGIIYDRSLGGSDGLNDINKQFSNTLSSLLGAFGMQSNIGTTSGMYQRGKSKKSGGIFNVNLDGQDLGRVSDVVLKKASMEAVYKALVENVFGAGLVKVIQRTNLDAPIKALFAGLTDKDIVGRLVNDVIRLGKNSELVNKSLDITISQVALMATESNVAGEQFTKLTDTLLQVADQASTVGDKLIGLKGLISTGIGMAVPDSLKAYDEALRGINTATVDGREQFLNLLSIRETFSQFTSAIDGLKGNVKGALFGIVSDAERQQIMNQDLAAMFAELNMTVPSSIQELIALGKSIDYTTAEGLNLASVFPTLVSAFNQTKGAVDSLIESLITLNPNRFETFADFAIGSSLANKGVGINQIPVRGASQGSDNQVAILLTRLIAEVSDMKASTQQTADNTLRTKQELEDITSGQRPLTTVSA